MGMEKEDLERRISKLEKDLRRLSDEHRKRDWKFIRDIMKVEKKLLKAGSFSAYFLNKELEKLKKEDEEAKRLYERKEQRIEEQLQNYYEMLSQIEKDSRIIESEIEAFKETSQKHMLSKYGVEISFNKADIIIVSDTDSKLENFKNTIAKLDDEKKPHN